MIVIGCILYDVFTMWFYNTFHITHFKRLNCKLKNKATKINTPPPLGKNETRTKTKKLKPTNQKKKSTNRKKSEKTTKQTNKKPYKTQTFFQLFAATCMIPLQTLPFL